MRRRIRWCPRTPGRIATKASAKYSDSVVILDPHTRGSWEKYNHYLPPNSRPRGRTAVGIRVWGRDRLLSERAGFWEVKHSRNLKTCSEVRILARCRSVRFGFVFFLVGETLLISSPFVLVREFWGPNSFLVGENLMAPHPHLAPFYRLRARESEFCGLSMWISKDFGRIYSFWMSQTLLAMEFMSSC